MHQALQLQCVRVILVKEPNALAILMQHVYQVFVVDVVQSFMIRVEEKCIVEVCLAIIIDANNGSCSMH